MVSCDWARLIVSFLREAIRGLVVWCVVERVCHTGIVLIVLVMETFVGIGLLHFFFVKTEPFVWNELLGLLVVVMVTDSSSFLP